MASTRQGKLPVILAILLAFTLALPMVAAAGEQVAEREVDQARRRGQAWVEEIAVIDPEMAEWQGAYLTWALPFPNPKGEVIAYMFAVERKGRTVGRVLVGSAAYGYSILEGTKAPPFSIPSRGEVSSILRKEHGLQIPEISLGEPMLVLTQLLRGFFAVWEFEGQVVGISLMTDHSFVVPGLEALRCHLPTPLQYKAAKRATGQSMPPSELGLQPAAWVDGWIPSSWEMCAAWVRCYQGQRTFWCGPASATTIAFWKRDADGDTGFPNNPPYPQPGLVMFDGFHQAMGGWDWTLPHTWRSGFRNYAQSRNETFTFEVRLPGTYWQIVSDIESGWPLGLMGEMYIPWKEQVKPHWVAVDGYAWRNNPINHMIHAEDTAYREWCPVLERYLAGDGRWLCWHFMYGRPWGPWVIPVRDTD